MPAKYDAESKNIFHWKNDGVDVQARARVVWRTNADLNETNLIPFPDNPCLVRWIFCRPGCILSSTQTTRVWWTVHESCGNTYCFFYFTLRRVGQRHVLKPSIRAIEIVSYPCVARQQRKSPWKTGRQRERNDSNMLKQN